MSASTVQSTAPGTEVDRYVPLALYPMDVLFFGDGRPAATSTRLASRLPMPQTVGGAILATLLRAMEWDFEALRNAIGKGNPLRAALVATAPGPDAAELGALVVKGPWFARISGDQPKGYELLLPVPHDLYWLRWGGGRELVRLHPHYPSYPVATATLNSGFGAAGLTTMRPGKLEPVSGFLTERGFEAYLGGEAPPEDSIVPESEVVQSDHRVGIALSPDTLTSERGMLYGRSFLKLRPDIFVYVELEGGPVNLIRSILSKGCLFPLGGERRYVRAELLPQPWPLARWPENVSFCDWTSAHAALVLTTPGIYPDAVPPQLGLSRLRMSCRACQPVSGWNLALRGPRPTRTAAAAGTVYVVSPMRPLLPHPMVAYTDDSLYGWGCWVAGKCPPGSGDASATGHEGIGGERG